MVKVTNEIKEVIRARIERKFKEKQVELSLEISNKNKSDINKIKEYKKKLDTLQRELRNMENERDKIMENFDEKYTIFSLGKDGTVSLNAWMFRGHNSEISQEMRDRLFDSDEQFILAMEEIAMANDKEGVLKKIIDRINKL